MGKIKKLTETISKELSKTFSGVEPSKKSPHVRRKSLVSVLPGSLNTEKSKKKSEEFINTNVSKVKKRSSVKKNEHLPSKKKVISILSGEQFCKQIDTRPKVSQEKCNSDIVREYNMKLEDLNTAVRGVIKFHENNPKIKNQLFNESFPIFLQVNCHKIPSGRPKLMRIPLKNSVLCPNDEVCLIVSEVKGIGNKEHEKHIEHYENLLKNKGVTNIKKIMTFHEFRTEHETFEQKARLVDLYDAFLVCGKISGKVVHKCGKIFYTKRKLPIPVKLHASKLKDQIDKALSKAFFHIHLKGDSYTLQCGHSQMEPIQLVENICLVVEFLKNEFPGGMGNIKGLHVFAPRATSIPIYLSTKPPNNSEKIKMKTTKTTTFKTHTGELTTLPNARVTVRPTGEVIVRKMDTKDETDDKITDEDIIHGNKEETDIKEGTKRKQSQDTESSGFDDRKKKVTKEKKEAIKFVKKDKVKKTNKTTSVEKKKIIYTRKDKLKKIRKLSKKGQ